MSGYEFFKPIHSELTLNKTLANNSADEKTANRQQKIEALKASVSTGQYSVDLQKLGANILKSGVLNHE